MLRTGAMSSPDAPPIVLFDGVCHLCSAWVRFILRTDRHAVFRLAPVQSIAGQALLRQWAFPADRYDTIIVIADQHAYTESDAVLRIVAGLPQPWRWLTATRWVPRRIRNSLYRFVARHRYRWFGRGQTCRVPSASERRHFLPGADVVAQP